MLWRSRKQVISHNSSNGDIEYTKTNWQTIEKELKDDKKLQDHYTKGWRMHHVINPGKVGEKTSEEFCFLSKVEANNPDLLKNSKYVSFSKESLKSKNSAGKAYYLEVFSNIDILKALKENLKDEKVCSLAKEEELENHFNLCQKNAGEKDKEIYNLMRPVFEFGKFKEPTPVPASSGATAATPGAAVSTPANNTTPAATTTAENNQNNPSENVERVGDNTETQKNPDQVVPPEQEATK
jgi:hypothetical protein